ncbi:MAG: polysaccharide deacetylase family protein [Lachnospiraceae bacterium]|nr:polysaccharide deacetylase family protein [Lachnospiraceae bacterium]
MRFTYPDGLTKALTFSYDDGRIYDRRLVSIFNEYGMKGTFHLNSSTLNSEEHPNEESVSETEVAELYKGHEVACHGLRHRNPTSVSTALMEIELREDRKNLEALTGGLVQGLSYAYGNYTEETKQIARANGIKYSRTVNSTGSLWAPTNFLEWHPTCHHNDSRLFDIGKRFLTLNGDWELSLLYVWGHSFEFNSDNNWERIEEFARMMSHQEGVWYATNLEICDYITAVRAQEFSADGLTMRNPTAQTIWVTTKDGLLTVAPGACVRIGER